MTKAESGVGRRRDVFFTEQGGARRQGGELPDVASARSLGQSMCRRDAPIIPWDGNPGLRWSEARQRVFERPGEWLNVAGNGDPWAA